MSSGHWERAGIDAGPGQPQIWSRTSNSVSGSLWLLTSSSWGRPWAEPNRTQLFWEALKQGQEEGTPGELVLVLNCYQSLLRNDLWRWYSSDYGDI